MVLVSALPMAAHVIIVGAGASGLSAGVLLAREGMRVTLFERALLDQIVQSDLESYPIGVNPRGIQTLRMVDPALEAAIEVASSGKVKAWSVRGKDTELARLPSGTVIGTTRGKVVSALFGEAQATEGLTLRMGMKLVRADLSVANTLTFAGSDGNEEVVDISSARVLDCSGCFSKLRSAVAAADPSFEVLSHLLVVASSL